MTDDDINPSAVPDTIASFALDLRALRLRARQPTLETMQRKSGVSRTVISSAFGGKTLPSARTVDHLVRALGEDPSPWLERRDRLAAESFDAALLTEETGEGLANPVVAQPARRRFGPLVVGLAAMGTLLLGGALGAWLGYSAGASAAAAAPTAFEPETGMDPGQTPCVNDARVATSSQRFDDTVLLEIVWSDKCRAGWGRLTRYDDNFQGNTVMVTIFPKGERDGDLTQRAEHEDVQGAYTEMIVRPGNQLLCAMGSITVGTETLDLGDPICI